MLFGPMDCSSRDSRTRPSCEAWSRQLYLHLARSERVVKERVLRVKLRVLVVVHRAHVTPRSMTVLAHIQTLLHLKHHLLLARLALVHRGINVYIPRLRLREEDSETQILQPVRQLVQRPKVQWVAGSVRLGQQLELSCRLFQLPLRLRLLVSRRGTHT